MTWNPNRATLFNWSTIVVSEFHIFFPKVVWVSFDIKQRWVELTEYTQGEQIALRTSINFTTEIGFHTMPKLNLYICNRTYFQTIKVVDRVKADV